MEKRKPNWLKSKRVCNSQARKIEKKLQNLNLHTVCESAKCPNKGECYERGTATFIILGNVCTRNCTFCAVDKSINHKLMPVNEKEPQSIAEVVKELEIKHVVITTVTRDDLPDGGAFQFVRTVQSIRKTCSEDTTIEVLISDLEGNMEALEEIVSSKPDIINHNVETIPGFYHTIRPEANFDRSLSILEKSKHFAREKGIDILTKSGFMLGFGETEDEVINLISQLVRIETDIVTMGQYLAPSNKHHPVVEYVHPDKFLLYKNKALSMGIKVCEASPLVRSSYHAEQAIKKISQFNKGGNYANNHYGSTL